MSDRKIPVYFFDKNLKPNFCEEQMDFFEYYRLRNKRALTWFIVFIHRCWGNWNFQCDIKFPLLSHHTHSLVESLRKFLSVADLIVDGRNTYQQSQCSPQKNSNSQPWCTRLYLPVSTILAQLPAIRSSICLDPTIWPARSRSFHQYSFQRRGITHALPPLQGLAIIHKNFGGNLKVQK